MVSNVCPICRYGDEQINQIMMQNKKAKNKKNAIYVTKTKDG
jgi:hypothetical protein